MVEAYKLTCSAKDKKLAKVAEEEDNIEAAAKNALGNEDSE